MTIISAVKDWQEKDKKARAEMNALFNASCDELKRSPCVALCRVISCSVEGRTFSVITTGSDATMGKSFAGC